MPRTPEAQFYQLYFQEPGTAEAEFERDPIGSIRAFLVGASGDAPQAGARAEEGPAMVRRGSGFLDAFEAPRALPAWLSEADVDVYATEFARTGFCGGLNWYRNMDRNWELLAAYEGAKVTVPALYVAGDRDLVVRLPGIEKLIPSLRDTSRSCGVPSCSRAAGTGRSRSAHAKSARPSWSSCKSFDASSVARSR
jgi:pimeloyl-ACP methyl ester carboxylesterase